MRTERRPAGDAAAGIRARGVVKRFGRTHALAGAEVDVAPGQLVAVTGANGAGKTTLLRVLATLVVPDAGTASVAGFDVVSEAAAVRRSIGVALVNDRGLYWRLTGIQNLRFFARAIGLSARAAAARADEVAAAMDIDQIAGRAVSGYSAGQRQRLILARASLGDPAALLVDEPMRGLDEDGIARVRSVLRVHADRGCAVLVAGPTIAELSDLCDEIVVLRDGALVDRLVGARADVPATAVNR